MVSSFLLVKRNSYGIIESESYLLTYCTLGMILQSGSSLTIILAEVKLKARYTAIYTLVREPTNRAFYVSQRPLGYRRIFPQPGTYLEFPLLILLAEQILWSVDSHKSIHVGVGQFQSCSALIRTPRRLVPSGRSSLAHLPVHWLFSCASCPTSPPPPRILASFC